MIDPPAAVRAEVVTDDHFPADPYPGLAPGFSFVHDDAVVRRLHPDPGVGGGWRVSGAGAVDAWLLERGAPPLAERVPVLAYGSNRCPQKITWLRRALGLTGPVVGLQVTVRGVAAVWAAGWRARDGVRPATLAAVDGPPDGRRPDDRPETHVVWLATPGQVRVLDACEGRGERYDLAWLRDVDVRLDDDTRLDPVLAYRAADPVRAPLLVDGAPVRVRDVGQEQARGLVGEPAGFVPDAPGVVVGEPDPRTWPDRVFVYGTLQPGASAWWRTEPLAAGAPAPAVTAGRVYDTGRGYPALVRATEPGAPGRADLAHGYVVPLADPAAALPVLDEYEGPDYRRERIVVYREANDGDPDEADEADDDAEPAGELCWAWVWDGPLGDWPAVSGSWSG